MSYYDENSCDLRDPVKVCQDSIGHTLRTADPIYAQGTENLFPLDCYSENTLLPSEVLGVPKPLNKSTYYVWGTLLRN